MALIKCVECGKIGVSSTAVACPQCGANIRLILQQQEKIKRKIEFENSPKQQEIKRYEEWYRNTKCRKCGGFCYSQWIMNCVRGSGNNKVYYKKHTFTCKNCKEAWSDDFYHDYNIP